MTADQIPAGTALRVPVPDGDPDPYDSCALAIARRGRVKVFPFHSEDRLAAWAADRGLTVRSSS
jgi:hypothetical protein